jgi:hypothetical protein
MAMGRTSFLSDVNTLISPKCENYAVHSGSINMCSRAKQAFIYKNDSHSPLEYQVKS